MRHHASRHRVLTLALTIAVTALGLAVPSAHATHGPPAPANLVVSDVDWNTVELSWDAPRDDLPSNWYYEITYVTRGWTDAVGTWATSLRASYIEPDSTYTFEVRLIADGVASRPTNRVTVTTPSMPEITPPANLHPTQVYAGGVYLAWEAGLDDPDRSYRVRRVAPTTSNVAYTTKLSAVTGQPAGVTYSYEVVAIDGDGVVSGPSNRLTVTTPELEPPDDLAAVRDANDVTLTWSRPDAIDPARGVFYHLYDKGLLVAQQTSADQIGDGVFELTLDRVSSGATHDYTLELKYANQTQGSGLTDPVSVNVPASNDTMPPTPPAAESVFVYETATTTFTITEQSTDDTTPQSRIHYESLSYRWVDGQRVFFAADENIPLQFDDRPMNVRVPQFIRAVDEAGNRSEIVEPEFILIDN